MKITKRPIIKTAEQVAKCECGGMIHRAESRYNTPITYCDSCGEESFIGEDSNMHTEFMFEYILYTKIADSKTGTSVYAKRGGYIKGTRLPLWTEITEEEYTHFRNSLLRSTMLENIRALRDVKEGILITLQENMRGIDQSIEEIQERLQELESEEGLPYGD